MKRLIVIIAVFVLVGFIALLVMLSHSPTDRSAGTVQLAISGPEGLKFAGSYVADGKTNLLSAVVPSTISVRARQLTYSFKADDSRELHVVLSVDDHPRTSGGNSRGSPVTGGWHRWHHDFRRLMDMVLNQGIFNKNSWVEWIDGESYWGG